MVPRARDARRSTLVEALEAVAAEPERQALVLADLTAVAEQIRRGEPSTELLDVSLVREGLLPPAVGLLIQRIDELFDALVARDPAETFSLEALRHGREWRLMRTLAREALAELGAPVTRLPTP